MAEFVNSIVDAIRNNFEREVAEKLFELPQGWMFWHEPVIGDGRTPDFVILVDEEHYTALIILEVKNGKSGRRDYFLCT